MDREDAIIIVMIIVVLIAGSMSGWITRRGIEQEQFDNATNKIRAQQEELR